MKKSSYKILYGLFVFCLFLLSGCEEVEDTESDSSLEQIGFEDLKIAAGQEWKSEGNVKFPFFIELNKDVNDLFFFETTSSTILWYQSEYVDFRIVEYHKPFHSSGIYTGPNTQTMLYARLKEDIKLTMSCNEKWVYSYDFLKEEYDTYVVSIHGDNFTGKCAYHDDVLVELSLDGEIVFHDTFPYRTRDYLNAKDVPDYQHSIFDESDFVSLAFSDLSSGYFSTKDIELGQPIVGYKIGLERFYFRRFEGPMIKEELDYSVFGTVLEDILSEYQDTKVCTVILENFYNTDCVNSKLFQTEFLIELHQENDNAPNQYFVFGLGYYDNASDISMFVRGSNRYGDFNFLITQEYCPEIRELYDIIYEQYN